MNRRSIVYISVFGTLWGFSEATLGTFLHMLHLPFSGSILSAIGLTIILIARVYNPTPGSTILMGFIAGSIKMLSYSTVKIGPFVGIVMEGALVEGVLSFLGLNRISFIISGIIVGMYPVLQNVVTKTIVFGTSFVPVALDLIQGVSEYFGYAAGWWMLGLYVVVHLIFGLTAAYLAWELKKRVNLILEQHA